MPISVFVALSTVFHSINSPDSSPCSHSVPPVLPLAYWSFQLCISLWKSSSALILWSVVVDGAQNSSKLTQLLTIYFSVCVQRTSWWRSRLTRPDSGWRSRRLTPGTRRTSSLTWWPPARSPGTRSSTTLPRPSWEVSIRSVLLGLASREESKQLPSDSGAFSMTVLLQ